MTESLIPAGSWKLPGLGETRKSYVIGVGAVLLVGVALYVRKHRAAKSGATTTDSAGNVGVINPATGFVTGSAEDLAALSAAAGTTGSGGGGGGGGGDTSVGTQVQNGPPFTSNAAWSQYAIAQLVATNADPGAVSTDIGAYLGGAQITPAQRDVILQARALAGDPPTAGTGGFPPAMHVVGDVTGPSPAPGAVALTVSVNTPTRTTFTWPRVTGATMYGYSATGEGYSRTGRVTQPAASLSDLSPGHTYTMRVHALNGSTAGPDASVTFTVPTSSATPTTPTGPAAYATVIVTEYNTLHADWRSTMGGIAEHYGYGGDWSAIWNDPRNDHVRKLRGSPDHIRAGDHIEVKER